MRKFGIIASALVAVLAVAAIAYAQQATNQYTAGGAISPTKGGSTKKPVPVTARFDALVTEAQGLRPETIEKFDITFESLRFMTDLFPGCTASRINNSQSNPKTAVCPRGSAVGSGIAHVQYGDANTQSQKVDCYLDITLYNSKKQRAAIYVDTVLNDPGFPEGATACPLAATAIPANFEKRARGTAMVFTIPANLRDVRTIETALVQTRVRVPRKTRMYRGKRRGYVESIGCLRRGRRTIVKFTDEAGRTQPAQSKTHRCTK
jgi:hypothetical protein